MSLIPSRPSWATDFGIDKFGYYADMTVNTVVQRFRYCPPGSFMMGSPRDEPGRWSDEGPQHQVRLTKGFWLGDTPVTQALWMVTGRKNPSRRVHERRPVEDVNWYDAMSFCVTLGCTLPTEAQWEYACRAGTTTALYTGHIQILDYNNAPALDPIAWHDGNSGKDYDLKDGLDRGTRIVATRQANPWGLFDMLGNVAEWCRDNHRHYTTAAVDDPCTLSGDDQVIRGGCWHNNVGDVRAAFRNWLNPGIADVFYGFRLLKPIE